VELFLSYLRWLLRHRRAATLALLACTAVAVWSARRVYLRFAFTDFYEYPGNPDVPVLEKYYKDFGDPGGYVVLLVQAPDVFQRPVLDYVEAATHALEPSKQFSRVISLVNAKAVSGHDGEVTTGALMAQLPRTPEETERVRAIAVHSQLLARRLVATDSSATVVLAELAHPGGTFDEERAGVEEARRIVAGVPLPAGVTATITGSPNIDVEGSQNLIHDQLIFVPAAVLLILVVTFVIFRSVHAVLMLSSAIGVAVLWSVGVWPLLGRPIDMIASTFPAILLVYGAVDPVFVLSRFLTKLDDGVTREGAIVATFREMALPCFLTSVTTALGFLTFATLDLPTLVAFGLVLGVGVMFAFVTTVTVLPLLLSVVPLEAARQREHGVHAWLDRRLAGLAGVLARRGGVVLVLGAVLLVGALVAARQEISVSYLGWLPSGPTKDAARTLEQKLSGVIRMSVLIEGPPGSMKRPEVLRAIEEVDAVAEQHAIVLSSVSLADLVKEINAAFVGQDGPETRRIPGARALIAQYLAILDPDDLADFVDSDLARTHIRVLSEDRGSAAWRPLRDDLERSLAVLGPLGLKGTLTGSAAVIFPVLDRMVVEMVLGFVYGFGIIVLLQLLIFRSWRIALLSIFPNLIPAACCFVMVKLVSHLAVGTSLPLSAAIGGLFNTTIHMSARALQRAREGGATPDEVIEHALRKVTPPSLFTAVILSLGFAIFTLSSFPDLRLFGVLTMAVLLVGFVSDLLLTPVLLRRFLPWKKLGGGAPSP
jgi:predicted RND superfamily exporter protein